MIATNWLYLVGTFASLSCLESFDPSFHSPYKQANNMVATRRSPRVAKNHSSTTALFASSAASGKSRATPVTPLPKKKRKIPVPLSPRYDSSDALSSEIVPEANPSQPYIDLNISPEAARSSATTPVTPSPKKKRKVPVPLSPRYDSSDALTSEAVAEVNPGQPYIDLKIPPEELRPSATLTTGQCFHWRAVQQQQDTEGQKSAWGSHDATEWVGILRTSPEESVMVAIRETPETTLYRPLTKTNCDLQQFLHHYFQLQYSLKDLYSTWSEADERLFTIAKCIPGVRIVDQDPWECLISFICSSNNNIPRISKILSAIRREYGSPLVTIGDQTFYSFPSCADLAANANDEDLRAKCGLGYRSKYILETIQILQKHGGESYLQELRTIDDAELVQTKLCEFCGVGRKVADCVALFSLRQDSAVPVDVHVWNIARRDYDPQNDLAEVKSLTPTTYKQIGDLFRTPFPEKAGWAHSLLFVAELPSFRPVLPARIIQEMDQFRQEEQLRKQGAKAIKQRKKAKLED
jgi:N-glycosylase/DNA lyase